MERWRAVVGFEGKYEVSDRGRVRSATRTLRQLARGGALYEKTVQGTLLRPGVASNGYWTVCLGRGNTRTVHSLVAEAFLGPCPEGQEVRHIDGNRLNSAADNLVYGTRAENIQDAIAHGTWMSEKRLAHMRRMTRVRLASRL